MSRNLYRDSCKRCGGAVVPTEPTRRMRADECRPYEAEYEEMLIANAQCKICEARYLAWMSPYTRNWSSDHGVYDLSFRSTFNDEPGEDDLPEPRLVREMREAGDVGPPWSEARELLTRLLLGIDDE